MALKFLNKKGWHTGSLRNIENVWKAEQKHDAEQKKLEELRKQIHEERERAEFRQLQEQAGLVPQQERLEFLYDSGLSVGKSSASDGFKALETLPSKQDGAPASSSEPAAQSNVPGALFEDKPHSANDAWRKLHSDPLLMIRQREQEALARIKNNPVKMAMIKKTVEGKKLKEKSDKERRKKRHHSRKDDEVERRKTSHRKKSNYDKHSDFEDESPEKAREKKGDGASKYREHLLGVRSDLSNVRDDEVERRTGWRRSNYDKYTESKNESPRKASRHEKKHHVGSRYREQSPGGRSYPETVRNGGEDDVKENPDKSEREKYYTEDCRESQYKRRRVATRLSEEERAARLREMQLDAELHEEQRWKRLKKAAEDDAREAKLAGSSGGRSFLDAAQKSVYGADKGGSATIAESVRRRAYYSQGGSEASSGNAFRR